MKKSKIYTPLIILLSGFICICFLLFNQCKFEEPAAPNWDVNFILPLLSEKYTMEDLAKDVKEISIEDDTVWVNMEKDFDSEKVGEKLKIDGTSKTFTILSGGSISDAVSIPGDDIILDSATISCGSIQVSFKNLGSQTVDIHFASEDLKNANGAILTIDETVPGNTEESKNINLENFTITPLNNQIHFNGSLTGGNGNVEITVQIQELTFSQVSGKLNQVEINIDSLESDFEIPEEFKDFAVKKANIQIAFNSTISFPFDIDITIEALESRNQLPDPIHITEYIESEQDTITIGDIADFINSQPTNILVYGNAFIGRGEGSHTITENDSISGTVLFNAPLIISIPSYESKMEPDTLSIDEDVQDFIRDNLISAEFNAEVENGLPIGTNVSIVFSNTCSDSLIYDNGKYDLKFDLNLKKAPTSNTDPAVVTGTEHSSLNITLEQEELSHFINNDTLFVGFKFVFLGSDDMTKFRSQDYIQIEASISALVNTTVPEDEEE